MSLRAVDVCESMRDFGVDFDAFVVEHGNAQFDLARAVDDVVVVFVLAQLVLWRADDYR
jgi:hypothetical protein